MKNFFESVPFATVDTAVGIAIAKLATGVDMHSFGTRMKSNTQVSCHVHEHGEEWYIILAGQGRIYLADYSQGQLDDKKCMAVKPGDIFCIQEKTAHQLFAETELDFIFLCPESHLGSDRILCEDLL